MHGKIWIKKIIKIIAEFIYPSNIYCISCGSPIMRDSLYSLCDTCLSEVSWANGNICEKCGKLLEDWYPDKLCGECKNIIHLFDRGMTCTQYRNIEKEMLKAFKYHGKGYMSGKLSQIMFDRLTAESIEANMILPVPMYAKKERKRGYNQADLLAKSLAEISGISYDKNILLRIKNTDPMNKLNAKERKENISGAFCVRKSKQESIKGMKIILIDDIFTTGATADGCSRALKSAGAEKVYLLSFSAGINQRPLPDIRLRESSDV